MKIEKCVREVSLKLSRMWERRCRRADCRGGYEETNAGVDMKQRENKYFAHTCVRNTDIHLLFLVNCFQPTFKDVSGQCMNSQTFQKPHNWYLCDISLKRVTYMPEALIRNVTFPAVQNFLHIYAEQDLRARNTVREPSELNKMSDSDEIVCWARILELGGRAWASQCGRSIGMVTPRPLEKGWKSRS